MPFDFNLDEEDTSEQPEESPVQERGQIIAAPSDAAQDVLDDLEEDEKDEPMSEVQRRLAIAQYCDLILRNDLFGGDKHPAAIEVQNRIRKYLKHELEVMVGIKQEKAEVVVKSEFSSDEVTALKMLAGKVLKTPSLLDMKEEKKPPTLHKIEAKPTPVVQPKLQQVRVAKPIPSPVVQTEAPVKRGRGRPPIPKILEVLPTGEKIIKEGSKIYKLINVNGKEIRMDITKPADNPNKKPMPTYEQMNAQAELESQRQVSNAHPLISLAISESMKGN